MEYVFYAFVLSAIATIRSGMVISKSSLANTQEILYLSFGGIATICWTILLGYGVICAIQWFCGLYNTFF